MVVVVESGTLAPVVATLDQCDHHVKVPGDASVVERGATVHISVVDVSPETDQLLHHPQIAHHGGGEERSSALCVSLVNIGPQSAQLLYHLHMALNGGNLQRGAATCVGSVNVGPLADQILQLPQIAIPGSQSHGASRPLIFAVIVVAHLEVVVGERLVGGAAGGVSEIGSGSL